jgi:flagellar FliL protein
MAVADEELVEAPPARKKKSRLPMIIGLVVVLLALGGGGFAYKTMHAKAAAKNAKPAPKAELYLPLDPPFVVNFRDDDSLRYLQVGVTLMSHDADALAAAKSADPVIRDALVSLFSSQEYSIISNTAGRDKLQAQALAAVRKVVQERLGRPGIDALYFTSFVMQ